MRSRTAFVLLFIAVAMGPWVPAAAQQTDRERDIRELFEITGAAKLGLQIVDAMIPQIFGLFEKSKPGLPPEAMAILKEELNDAFREGMPDMMDSQMKLYEKYFTSDDIEKLLEFYRTDVGRKAIRVLPAIMQESIAIGQEWSKRTVPGVVKRATERLQREGFITP